MEKNRERKRNHFRHKDAEQKWKERKYCKVPLGRHNPFSSRYSIQLLNIIKAALTKNILAHNP